MATFIFLMVAGGLFAHLLLLILALSRRNVLPVLAAALCLLAPLSLAMEFSTVLEWIKYLRIYTTVMAFVVAVLLYRVYRPGPATMFFNVFVGFFFLASLWSPLPVEAAKFKGLYVVLVSFGACVAFSLNSYGEIRSFLRLITATAALFALFMLLGVVKDPAGALKVGRWAAWGMNPNLLSAPLSLMGVFCAHQVLNEAHKRWRLAAFISGLALAVGLLYTGSRGGAAAAIIGCTILAVPFVKRPGVLVLSVSAMLVVVATILHFLGSTEGLERMTDTSLGTRDAPWTAACEFFTSSPLIGVGWVYTTKDRASGSTQNLHSMYWQILAETGVLGMALFTVALLGMIAAWLRLRRWLAGDREAMSFLWLSAALCTMTFANGLVESSPLLGTTLHALVLGFGIGLIDQLPRVAWAQAQAAWAWAAEESGDAAGAEYLPAVGYGVEGDEVAGAAV